MFARLARTAAAPIAALMRLLRSSAQLHPLVFSVTPCDEPVAYQHKSHS